MKKRLPFLVILFLVILSAAAAVWWAARRHAAQAQLLLYGNVDTRQVELPFRISERIGEVLVEEGARVTKGQPLARLEPERLESSVALAQAQLDAQQHALDRLENGTRPEEIEQARANAQGAEAQRDVARLNNDRQRALLQGSATSQVEADAARLTFEVASARLIEAQKTLELAVAGPRKEDIAQARAQLRAAEAQLKLLKRDLTDAVLLSPVDGVIRSRIMEPGEMASPQRPVFTIAVMSPKWVRAYVSETDLGRLHPGAEATVTVDSSPGRTFGGWVGFISPVAEFTPKSVETPELRTSLVYEVRVFVKDPDDDLRLGMPATISLAQLPAPVKSGEAR